MPRKPTNKRYYGTVLDDDLDSAAIAAMKRDKIKSKSVFARRAIAAYLGMVAPEMRVGRPANEPTKTP